MVAFGWFLLSISSRRYQLQHSARQHVVILNLQRSAVGAGAIGRCQAPPKLAEENDGVEDRKKDSHNYKRVSTLEKLQSERRNLFLLLFVFDY